MAEANILSATNIDALQLQEQASAPSTPASGYGRIYVKDDGTFHFINDAGTDTDLTAGGGGGASTALSNLASVAINTSLISDTTLTDDLGSASILWANSYIRTLYFAEQTAPGTPASGLMALYAKSNGLPYVKNDTGIEFPIAGANVGSEVTKTLSGDRAYPSQGEYVLKLAASSGTADDLIEIDGSNSSVGDIFYITADTGDTITVKHNDSGATAKIYCRSGADTVLSETQPMILHYKSANELREISNNTSASAKASAYGTYTAGANDTSNSTSYADVDTTNIALSITPNSASATVIAIFTFVGAKLTAGTGFYRLQIDATTNSGETEIFQTSGLPHVTVIGRFTGLTAAAHTIRLQFKSSDSNFVYVYNEPVNMIAWEV